MLSENEQYRLELQRTQRQADVITDEVKFEYYYKIPEISEQFFYA